MPVKLKNRPKIKDKLGKHGQPLKVTTGYYLSESTLAELKRLAKKTCASIGDVVARLSEFCPQLAAGKVQYMAISTAATRPKRLNSGLTMLASQHRRITKDAHAFGVAREALVDALVFTFGGLL